MAIGPAKAGPICLLESEPLGGPSTDVPASLHYRWGMVGVKRFSRGSQTAAREAHLFRKRIAVTALIFSFALLALGSTEALAARAGGGGGHKPRPSASSLSLVLLNSTDGLSHWGQDVTFTVSTTATTEPNVSLVCYQSGVLVYGAVAGFYASYPWPWDQTFILSSPSWTGGGADCTATLYYISGSGTVPLATMSFHAYP